MDESNPTTEKGLPLWTKAFLAALAITGNVTRAIEACQAERTCVYDLRKKDSDFRRAWEEAIEQAADLLESEARRRAHDGVSRPVIFKGKPVFVWMKDGDYVPAKTKGAKRVALMEHDYSDTLLIFLLNGARPEKYRKRLEHSGPNGGPIAMSHAFDLSKLTDEELEQYETILEKCAKPTGGESGEVPPPSE